MKKIFVCCFLVVILVVPLLIITGNTNNKRSSLNQKPTYVHQEYKANPDPKPTYTYQEHKAKHKRDKEVLELLALYNSWFNPKLASKAYSVQQHGYGVNGECIGKDSDVFCSKELWDSYGIYTNISQEVKKCFCKCDSDYKTDECVLVRRKAVDEDIGFFDYKFFLPDDLKMSKDKFKQVAYKYKVAEAFKYFKCLDKKLELISAEREACVGRVEDYIKNLSYNKISICKKKYNIGRCSDEQIARIDTEKAHCIYLALGKHQLDESDWYGAPSRPTREELLSCGAATAGTSKEICEQVKRMQFEIDNNCVLKE